MDEKVRTATTLCLILLLQLSAGASDVDIDDGQQLFQGKERVTHSLKLRNGTMVEVYPPLSRSLHMKGDGIKLIYSKGGGASLQDFMEQDWREREMLGEAHGFRMCARCRCCDASGVWCLRLPCCFSINCAAPNQPFGQCSLTPFSCNCFSC